MSTNLFDILKHGMPGAQETVAVPTQPGDVLPPLSALSELLTIYEAKTEPVQLPPFLGASIAASLLKPTPDKSSLPLPDIDNISSRPRVSLAVQTAAQEIKNIRGRCEALLVALAQSRSQTRAVTAQLSCEEGKNKELQNANRDLTGRCKQLEKDAEVVQEALNLACGELQRAHVQHDAVSSALYVESSQHALTMAALTSTVAALATAQGDLKALVAELSDVKQELEAQVRENGALRTALAASRERAESAETHTDELREQLSASKQHARQLEQDKTALDAQAQKLSSRVVDARASVRRMESEAASNTQQIRTLKRDTGVLRSELAESRQHNAALVSSNGQLTQDLHSAQASIVDLRDKLTTSEEQKTAAELKLATERKGRKAKEDKLWDTIMVYLAGVEMVEDENKMLAEQVAQLRDQNEQLLARNAHLEDQNAHLEERNEHLEGQTSDLQGLVYHLRDEQRELEAQHEASREVQAVKMAVLRVRFSRRLSRTQSSKHKAQRQRAQLAQARAKSRRLQALVDATERHPLGKFRSKAVILQAQLKEAAARSSVLEESLVEVTAHAQRLERQVNYTRAFVQPMIDGLKVQLQDTDAALAAKTAELDSFKASVFAVSLGLADVSFGEDGDEAASVAGADQPVQDQDGQAAQPPSPAFSDRTLVFDPEMSPRKPAKPTDADKAPTGRALFDAEYSYIDAQQSLALLC